MTAASGFGLRRRQRASSSGVMMNTSSGFKDWNQVIGMVMSAVAAVDADVRPQRDGVADLLVGGAEHRDREADGKQQHERRAMLRMLRATCRRRFAHHAGLFGQIAAAPDVDHQARHHADAGGAEAPVPAVEFAERAADQAAPGTRRG